MGSTEEFRKRQKLDGPPAEFPETNSIVEKALIDSVASAQKNLDGYRERVKGEAATKKDDAQ